MQKKASVIAMTVVGAAVAATVIAPTFIKPEAQQHLANWQQHVNDQPGYTLEMNQVDDGWFGATYDATLTMDLDVYAPELANLTENGSLTIPAQVQSAYGPVFFNGAAGVGLANVHVQVDASKLPEYVQWDRTQPFYQIDVKQGFGGGFSYTDSVVGFEVLDDASSDKVVFSGYQGSGVYQSGKLEATGQVDNIAIEGMMPATLENYRIDFTTDTPMEEFFSGKMVDYTLHSTLERFDMVDLISVSDISSDISSKLDAEQQQANLLLETQIDKVDVTDLYEAENVLLTMEVNNISAEFMQRYNEFVSETLTEASADHEQLMKQFLRDNLALALAPNPEFNISTFSAEFDDGSFEFGAHSQVAAQQPLDVNQLFNNPMYLAQQVQADASLQIDQELLQGLTKQYLEQQLQPNLDMGYMSQEEFDQAVAASTEQVIQSFVAQGLLEQRDDVYVSNFVMNNGEMTLNGSAMNL